MFEPMVLVTQAAEMGESLESSYGHTRARLFKVMDKNCESWIQEGKSKIKRLMEEVALESDKTLDANVEIIQKLESKPCHHQSGNAKPLVTMGTLERQIAPRRNWTPASH